MCQIIYLEATMKLLVDSMKFKHQAQMDTFLEGFIESETKDGVVYYIEND